MAEVRSTSPQGRPRDAAVDRAVLRATQELLAEMSYDRLSIDAIAVRSGVARTSIYRRWDTKFDVVRDALLAIRPIHEFADTGSLRDDLLTYFDPKHAVLGVRSLFIGIVGQLHTNPDLAKFIDDYFIVPGTKVMREMFERAIARGEVREDIDLEILARVLPAMMWERRLFGRGRKLDSDYVRRVVDEVVVPLTRLVTAQ